jgi:DNA-binding NtrC family response regulator
LAEELIRSQALGLILLRLPALERDRPEQRQAIVDRLAAEARALAPFCWWGEFAPDTLALVCPELSETQLLRDRLTGRLGEEGQRFQLGHAMFPRDGASVDALYDAALSRWTPGAQRTVEEPLVVDPAMVRLWASLDRIAAGSQPLLVMGPIGSGRETLARAIHQRSGRRGGFTVVSGAALTAKTFEGLLFGYEGGTPGLFDAASEGTAFIQNLNSAPAAVLERLAQVVASRRFSRLGAKGETPLTARVVASSSRTLSQAVFSECTLELPGLADRQSDVVPLAELFLGRFRKLHGRGRLILSAEARARLQRHTWPGNVGELRTALERAVLASDASELRTEWLPGAAGTAPAPSGADLRTSLKAVERETFLKVLATTRWNVSEAAKQLGLPRRTVVYRMAKLGLRRPARPA